MHKTAWNERQRDISDDIKMREHDYLVSYCIGIQVYVSIFKIKAQKAIIVRSTTKREDSVLGRFSFLQARQTVYFKSDYSCRAESRQAEEK